MRLSYVRRLILLLPVVCLAQSGTPVIGVIDYYGVRDIPVSKLAKAIGVAENQPLPRSKAQAEERLIEIEGVAAAHLEAACCVDGKAILYIGIEERGANAFSYRTAPTEEVAIPADVDEAYDKFIHAVNSAARAGVTGEDLTQGHSLMADATARAIQTGFVDLAETHGEALREVLRRSGDPERRAIAAYVLGYAKNKKSAHDDLQFALQDPDMTVRANALRGLAALAVLERKSPNSGVKVSATWLVEMLNSVSWTDRNNASVALVTITESRNPSILQQLRDRALPSLVEMARWKHLPHALPAFILAGRVAGLPEEKIQAAWEAEDRETVINAALASKR
jgi:hypothetical protein